MSELNMSIFYVNNPQVSADFYATLLGRQPVENSPGFIVFVLNNGHRLAFWTRSSVLPPVAAAAGESGELVLHVDTRQALEQRYSDCCEQGMTIVHPPEQMHFGINFVAQDPDGLRLRFLLLTGA